VWVGADCDGGYPEGGTVRDIEEGVDAVTAARTDGFVIFRPVGSVHDGSGVVEIP
jgi:hypothetical protein